MSIRGKVAVVTLGVAVPVFAAFPRVFPRNSDGPEVTAVVWIVVGVARDIWSGQGSGAPSSPVTAR